MWTQIVLQITGTITYQIPSPQALLYAVLISVIYGVGNYKDSLTKGEAFNYAMFLKTVVISVLAGVVISAMGLDPTTSYSYAVIFISSNAVLMKYIDEFVNNVVNFKVAKAAPAK